MEGKTKEHTPSRKDRKDKENSRKRTGMNEEPPNYGVEMGEEEQEFPPSRKRRAGDHSSSNSNLTNASAVYVRAEPQTQHQGLFSPPNPRLECDDYIRDQSVLNSEHEFIAAKGCVHVTIRKPRDEDTVQIYRESDLSDKDVRRIYKDTAFPDTAQHGASLSIVFCPMRRRSGDIKNIPISGPTYLAIKRALGLPPLALQILSGSLSMFFKFAPLLDSRNPAHRGIILNNNIALFCDFTLICVYDATRRMTRAICFGLDELDTLTIVDRLIGCDHTAHHYIIVPLLLVDFAVEELRGFTETRREEVRRIRRSLQMDTYLCGNEHQAIVDPTKIDIARITAQVTSLSQSIIGLSSRGKALVKFVNGLLQEFNPEGKESLPGLHVDNDICQSYRLRLEYMKDALVSVQDQLKASYDALQIQAQAIYSLTAQAENAQNLKMAELSRQIAETSLQTAKESKRVAEITLRDATDMRIIAAVTLFFLPGTFTATLFSTSFFNFQVNASGKGQTVTGWIWLYWTVTVTLTLLVMGSWWIMSHLRKRSIKLRNEKEPEG